MAVEGDTDLLRLRTTASLPLLGSSLLPSMAVALHSLLRWQMHGKRLDELLHIPQKVISSASRKRVADSKTSYIFGRLIDELSPGQKRRW